MSQNIVSVPNGSENDTGAAWSPIGIIPFAILSRPASALFAVGGRKVEYATHFGPCRTKFCAVTLAAI